VSTTPAAEPIDHDQLFKSVIREFFPELLTLFFPAQAVKYDLPAVTWLNPEVFADPPDGPRHVLDLVAELPKRNAAGDSVLALVHVEIESADSVTDIERRLPAYYFHLRRTRQKPVLPLVLFLKVGLDGLGVRAIDDPPDDGDPVMTFRYRYIGLRGLPAFDYLRGDSLLGATLAALMGAPKSQRVDVGVEAYRRVGESDLPDNQKALLGDLVETYIDLPDAELVRFRSIINANATGRVKPVNKTRVQIAREEGVEEGKEIGKEIGKEQGREIGIEEGDRRARRAMLTELLEARFGPVPDEVAARVAAEADADTLRRWLRAAGTADTLQAFRAAAGW
jgi:hypothetical protein